MKLSERVRAAHTPSADGENPWCARVWNAMAQSCAMGPDRCRREFSMVCTAGWPYEGRCACGRRWDVYENKLTKKG